MTTPSALRHLVGSWSTEATHPQMPGVVVRGTTTVEWLEGEQFVLVRARTDHPEFPDFTAVIGDMAHDRVGDTTGKLAGGDDAKQLRMHYYDSRGVHRALDATIDDASWQLVRMAQGFSQRFDGKFQDSRDTIVGQWQLSRDDVHWEDDLAITYRRRRS